MLDKIIPVSFDETLYRNIWKTDKGILYCPMNVYETLEEAKIAAERNHGEPGDTFHGTISFTVCFHLFNRDHLK